MEAKTEERVSEWVIVPATGALWMFEASPPSEYEWEKSAEGVVWLRWGGNVAERGFQYRYRRKPPPEWVEVSDEDAVREMKAHPDDEWQVWPEGDTSWISKTPPRKYVFIGSRYRRRPRK